MYRVETTNAADRDIDSIVDYIANTLYNPSAATDFVDAVSEKISDLQKYPYMYGLSKNSKLAKLGYHPMVIKGYVALYLIDDEKKVVYISRVFYGKSDYERLI